MQSEKKISVLIPIYKPNPVFFTEALDALMAQTCTDWTAVICSDSCDESTEEVLAPYLKDPRFTFIKNPKRLGIGGNWNACLKQAQGTFIAYLFQDDLWSPDYLAEAKKILEKNPTAGFVSLEHLYKVEGMESVSPLYEAVRHFRNTHFKDALHSHAELLRQWIEWGLTPNIIGEPSFVVMRKEASQRAGLFLSDMPQFLDVEYWTRLLLSDDWYFLRGNFGSFRVHAAGASAQNQGAGEGLFDRLRCFNLLVKTLSGEDRHKAVRARKEALRHMIGKCMKRVGSGRKISSQGSGELKTFCISHPLVVFGALLSYIVKGGK
jgi:glycosyltransferase involved in cell wall biosynthesis